MPQRHAKPIARRCVSRAGWTMPEAVVALAVTAALIACLALTTREGRRQASLGDNFANLKQFAFGYGAYAADHDDRVCTFSWRRQVVNHPGYPITWSDLDAGAQQAVEIIRRRTGTPHFPFLNNWFVHLMYSPLVLIDYLDLDLPQSFVAAPGDHRRLRWQEAISTSLAAYAALPPTIRPSYAGLVDTRWAYSSSYELAPAFYAPDARSLDPSYITVGQGSNHYMFEFGGAAPFGRRRLSEVRFPGQKVMMYESVERHFGPQEVYFGFPAARVPVLLVDGSVRVQRTGSANLGFQPNNPFAVGPTWYFYEPRQWEPPAPPGMGSVAGSYRFTRSGLRGRDWGGTEVRWVD